MYIIEKYLEILAQIEKVWASLTDPKIMNMWMGYDSLSKIDLQVGGGYEFFGGETTGLFTRISKPARLEYTWRMAK